jgi:hypothetical protein
MSGRGLVLLALSVTLSACASSKSENAEIRIVTDREALVDCTRVGTLPYENARGLNVPGDFGPRLQALVRSLGGNVIFRVFPDRREYDEVWSCPVEVIAVPR